jgi:hypothetical protein
MHHRFANDVEVKAGSSRRSESLPASTVEDWSLSSTSGLVGNPRFLGTEIGFDKLVFKIQSQRVVRRQDDQELFGPDD